MKELMKKTIFAFLLVLLSGCKTDIASDINSDVKPGNNGFVMGNGSTAVLLAHGLAASPYEIKDLAEYLAERNITVQVLRLAGHGTSLKDMEKTTWEDWYEDYENAFLELSKTKEKVYVGGMSLGGALALYLAENHDTAGVISLASPVYFTDWRVKYAWLFKYLIKYSERQITHELNPYYYDKFTTKQINEMMKLVNLYKKRLNKITEPVLIVQFVNDTRIKKESANFIFENVASKEKQLLWINGTGHVLTIRNLNPEAKQTFEKIYEFIKQ